MLHHSQRLACTRRSGERALPRVWLAGWVLGSLHAKCGGDPQPASETNTFFSKPALNPPTRASPCRSAARRLDPLDSVARFGWRRAGRVRCSCNFWHAKQMVACRAPSALLCPWRGACMHVEAVLQRILLTCPRPSTSRFRRRHCARLQLLFELGHRLQLMLPGRFTRSAKVMTISEPGQRQSRDAGKRA
jgi:hypothetical protein